MSYRTTDGERVNELACGPNRRANGKVKHVSRDDKSGKDAMGFHQYGGRGKDKNGAKKITRRISQGHGPDGDTRQDDVYVPPVLANPGCLIQGIKVGGGLMGAKEAHENEAPFPLKLAQWFIRGWCPPAGRVLDPFSGSGTTVHAAVTLGRQGFGSDLRLNQCQLGERRCQNIQLEPVKKPAAAKVQKPRPEQPMLFD